MRDAHAAPSYQDALRAVGRYFDTNAYHQVMITEGDDGYVARAFSDRQGTRTVEGIELPMSDVRALINTPDRAGSDYYGALHPLFPTGYQDFMRALGHELDQLGASQVHLVEVGGSLLVSYTARAGRRDCTRSQVLYDVARVEDLLNNAARRRSVPA